MNVLTVPRTAAALEYKVLRYPSHLLETRVVATSLPEDSAIRLAFERVLGALDSTAGALFDDDGLRDRGRLLTRRTEVLKKALTLEEKAEQRKAAADAKLREQTERAEAKKAEVRRQQAEKAAQVQAEKRAAKEAVVERAQARQKADQEAITSKVEATLAAERDKLDQQEARIEARAKAATAAPKAQLDKAVADSEAARQERADADRLAELAAAEREARKA